MSKNTSKQVKPKNTVKYIVISITAVLVLAIVITITIVLLKNHREKVAEENKQHNLVTATLNETGDVVIDKSTISDKYLTYISYEGLTDDIIAIKASDGSIKTAFNCCETCYYTGRSSYIKSGNDLECLACGMMDKIDDIGLEAENNCKPIPISDNEKQENSETIIIPKKTIEYWSETFKFWREESHIDEMLEGQNY